MADSIHANGIPNRPPGAIPSQALSHLMGHQVFPQHFPQRSNRPPISYPPTPIVANQPRTPGVHYSNLLGGERQLPTPAMTTFMLPSTPLSTSQAVLKLMQFSDRLTPDLEEATSREVWDTFVDDFFSRNGCIKLTLCNAHNGEKKSLFVPQLVMARFFMTQYECGVTSMQLTLDQTVEYFLPNGMLLECPRSSFIYRYDSGSLVVFSGTLTARLVLDARSASLKIAHLDFEVMKHEEFVARQNLQTSIPQKKSKQSAKKSGYVIPESPVGEWGLPPRIINLLQMTSSVTSFAEVVFTSLVAGVSPKEGLQMCAQYGTPSPFPNR